MASTSPPRPAPVLVFGYGNPSRGDDALGPEFVRIASERFAGHISRGALEVLTDFQLQVEHALDLEGRARVYFVDATASGDGPFSVTRVSAARDATFTTHLLSPASVLHTYLEVVAAPPPECWLLAVGGQDFELGAPMSARAAANLEAALEAFGGLLEGHSALSSPGSPGVKAAAPGPPAR